jgi:hypothetical protein
MISVASFPGLISSEYKAGWLKRRFGYQPFIHKYLLNVEKKIALQAIEFHIISYCGYIFRVVIFCREK